MIKINLLPAYILETRRVKALLRIILALVLLEVAALVAWIWAPTPFSLTTQLKNAQERLNEANTAVQEMQNLQSQVAEVRSSYKTMQSWVQWVKDSDRMPEKWIRWFELVNRYIPDEVVLMSSLSAPNSNTLTLSGQTSDPKAAARWYLNMLRSELIEPSVDAVLFQTATVGYPGELPTGPNPKMQQAVSIQLRLKPEYLEMLMVPAPPAEAGVGGGVSMMGRPGGGRRG